MNWPVDANWSQSDDSGHFIPNRSFGEYAVIGTTNALGEPNGLNGIANVSTSPPAVGAIRLGREATSTGTLNISAGTLTVLANTGVDANANGVVNVGVNGRGYLNMTGGTLSAAQLVTGGEQLTTGNGLSTVDLSGSSVLTLTGTTTSTLNRNLKITGPNVNFSTAGSVRLQAPNTYTAVITSPTAHSPIKSTGNLILGGTLQVNFSGLATNPAIGQTWDLFDWGGGQVGNFSNAPVGADVTVAGLPQPIALGATFRLRQTDGGTHGNRIQLIQDRTLVLQVNRDTGELKITNPQGGAINMDGYTVNSSIGGSLLTGYKGISGAPAADTGWTKTPNLSANVLAEIKQVGSFNVSGIGSGGVTLGTGFSKTAVATNVANFGADGEDLVFRYNDPSNGPRAGQIQYIGTKFENDLVLRVNPNTGVAFLKNDSLLTLMFDGYTILSTEPVLDGGSAWTGLGGTWEKSIPTTANALTQTNLTGSITLAPNQEVSIGDISAVGFTTAAAQAGLSLQFNRLIFGDYNGNGTVDAADYIVWRNGGPLRNEAVTPGMVTVDDYNYWRAHFGESETTFRVGSVVFDPTAGGAGSLAGTSSVPEPGTGWLLLIGLGSVFAVRSRIAGSAGRPADQASPIHRTVGRLGVRIMKRQFGVLFTTAAGISAVLFSALPALAATGGISLVNGDFNLPGGNKVRPFDVNGTPLASNVPVTTVGNGDRIGGIPGWTFSGPGTEIRFNAINEETMMPYIRGDSSVEPGGGFEADSGTHLTLSTLDGTVYQTAAVNVANLTANEKYKLTFQAFDAFTLDAGDPTFMQINNRAQLTAKVYYDNAGTRVPIVTQAFDVPSGGVGVPFTLEILGGTIPGVAVGKPIGIEFDTTTIERNLGMPEFPVAHSWVAIDNVLLQIAGVKAGDLNGDGAINALDYAIVRDNQQEAHIYSAEGELTGDNFVDLNDFRAFKSLFIAAGGGASTSDGGTVPEPSTFLLVLVAAGSLFGSALGRNRRRTRRLHSVWVLLFAMGAALMNASESKATLLAYDPFRIGTNPANGEYTVATLVGQNPTIGPAAPSFFRDPWTLGSAGQTVQMSSINYLGSPSIGGSVTGYGRTERYLTTAWDDTTSGTFYMGFQANFGTTPNADMGYRAVEFFPPGVVPGENRIGDIGYNQFFSSFGLPQQQAATAKMQFNIGPQQIIDGAPNSYLLDGSTHLIVLKFELSATDNSDTVSIFLDPTSAMESDHLANNVTAPFNFTLGSIGSASFDNDGHGGTTVFDELRVGTTFADVVPTFPTPGDTDGDGDVDLVDYQNIFDNFNLTGVDTLHGDVALSNGKQGADGKVDLGDFFLWKSRFPFPGGGSGEMSGTGGVPEPTSVVLALVSFALLGGCRRQICRA